MRTEMNTFGIYSTKRLARAVDNGASLDELLEIAGSTSVGAEEDEKEEEPFGKGENEEDGSGEEEIRKLLAEIREEYEKSIRRMEQEAVESVFGDSRALRKGNTE